MSRKRPRTFAWSAVFCMACDLLNCLNATIFEKDGEFGPTLLCEKENGAKVQRFDGRFWTLESEACWQGTQSLKTGPIFGCEREKGTDFPENRMKRLSLPSLAFVRRKRGHIFNVFGGWFRDLGAGACWQGLQSLKICPLFGCGRRKRA